MKQPKYDILSMATQLYLLINAVKSKEKAVKAMRNGCLRQIDETGATIEYVTNPKYIPFDGECFEFVHRSLFTKFYSRTKLIAHLSVLEIQPKFSKNEIFQIRREDGVEVLKTKYKPGIPILTVDTYQLYIANENGRPIFLGRYASKQAEIIYKQLEIED